MKILIRTAIALGIIVVIYVVIALFCQSRIHVERSLAIKADASTIFNQINDLKNWKNWSYWDNIDPNMKSSFEGPNAGVGAKHLWESENDSAGKGTLTITKSEPNTFVETELSFEDMGTSIGGWRIKDTAGSRTVSAYMDIDITFLLRPMMAMMDMEAMLGADFTKSLEGLRKTCEGMSTTPELRIEATTVGPMKVVTIGDSGTMMEIGEKLGAIYGEIGAYLKKEGATMAGAPFSIYHKEVTAPDGMMTFWFEAGVAVDKEVKSTDRIQYKEMPGGNVVKAMHYGSYEATAKSHELMQTWMSTNGKTVTGSPWESYVTDPMMEKDTAKWLTEIYYPVK